MAVPDELLLLMNEFEKPCRLTKPFTFRPDMVWVPIKLLFPNVAAVPVILAGEREPSAMLDTTAFGASFAVVMLPSATAMVGTVAVPATVMEASPAPIEVTPAA